MNKIPTAFMAKSTALTIGRFSLNGRAVRLTKIPIVGTKHMGLETFLLTGPVDIEHEPSNAFDPNALVVKYKGEPIGYIPKDKQHYFYSSPGSLRDFKQTASWEDLPKALNSGDSWSVFVLEPV